jgi:hypothetical protein
LSNSAIWSCDLLGLLYCDLTGREHGQHKPRKKRENMSHESCLKQSPDAAAGFDHSRDGAAVISGAGHRVLFPIAMVREFLRIGPGCSDFFIACDGERYLVCNHGSVVAFVSGNQRIWIAPGSLSQLLRFA